MSGSNGKLVSLTIALTLSAAACGESDAESKGSGGAGNASSTGGSAGAASGGTAGTPNGGSGGSGGSAAPKPSPGCSSGSLATGETSLTLEHGGVTREYRVFLPASAGDKTPLPLVLNFHGYTSNIAQQTLFSSLNTEASSAGFAVAYPQGLANPSGGQTSWNAGLCCAFGDSARDDVGFVDALLDDLFAKTCIDERRVYATGMSNGGFMTHRLGCERADRFAAIAPVAGVLGIPAADCKPSRPMPIVHFHGTGDSLVSYDGGLLGAPSVADTLQGWADRNGCTGPAKSSFTHGAAHCETHSGCKDDVEVTLCTIDGMGHCWPGQSYFPFGQSSTDISANQRMWELFQKFALP